MRVCLCVFASTLGNPRPVSRDVAKKSRAKSGQREFTIGPLVNATRSRFCRYFFVPSRPVPFRTTSPGSARMVCQVRDKGFLCLASKLTLIQLHRVRANFLVLCPSWRDTSVVVQFLGQNWLKNETWYLNQKQQHSL